MSWERVSGSIFVLSALTGSGCGDSFESCEEALDCDAPAAAGGEAGTDASGEGGEPGSGGGSGGGTEPKRCDEGCDSNQTCCDEFCIDLSSDSEHCGACGAACSADESEVACVEKECVIAGCSEGFVDCNGEYDDGCETEDTGLPDVPVGVAPMLGAYTGSAHAESSLTPTFRWLAPEETGTCGSMSYELELTTACKFGQISNCDFEDAEIRETGLTELEWTPEAPLSVRLDPPVGSPYFWRVRACEAETRCSEWSPVRYVNVGRLIDDVNGDGYSELLGVGNEASGSYQGLFFVGGATTPLTESNVLPISIGTPNAGRYIGDVNGDGFQDVLVWNASSTSDVPRVLLGSGSLATLGMVPMPQPRQVSHSGSRVGDLDGDGFAELAISEFDYEDQEDATGIVHVYRGSALLDLGSPLNLEPPAGSSETQFGVALEGGLDLDSDGFPDLAVMDGDEGLIHIARGGSLDALAFEASLESASLVNASSTSDTPPRLLAAGDMNGDGHVDLAAYAFNTVASTDNSVVMVFPGGDPLPEEPLWSITLDANVGLRWTGGTDFGDDGYADLLIDCGTDVGPGAFTASIRFLPGGTSATLEPIQVGDFGPTTSNTAQVASGDYDGDGHRDLVAGTATTSQADRKWLSGDATMTESPTCSQPEESFSQVGDWCSAKTVTVTAASPREKYLGALVQ